MLEHAQTESPEWPTQTFEPEKLMNSLDTWRFRLVLIVCIDIFVFLALFYYFPSGTDDTFISLWAGEQLAAGHGFVNHNGETLEISSSTFHVCVIALIALLAPNLVFTLNKLLGLAAGTGVVIAMYAYRNVLFTRGAGPLTAYSLTLLALAVNPAFLYWSMGGLETPYAALILTIYGLALTQFWTMPGASSAVTVAVTQCLYTVTRPEGMFVLLFTPIFVALFLWFKGKHRHLLTITLPPLLFYAAVIVWRCSMFGMALPNPVYAKTGDLFENLHTGVLYLLSYLSSSYFALFQLLVLVGLTGYFLGLLVKSIRLRHRADLQERMSHVFLFGLSITGLLVVAFSGGDWMAHSRFVVPFLPVLTIVAVTAVVKVSAAILRRFQRGPSHRLARVIAPALLLVLIGTTVFRFGPNLFQVFAAKPVRQESGRLQSYSLLAGFTSWSNLDMRMVGMSARHRKELDRLQPIFSDLVPDMLKQGRRITVVTPQMGLFPYMMKKRFPDADLYFIDLKGLCTPEVARMGLKRSLGGVRGVNLAVIFPPNATPLSRFINERNPAIVFVHKMDDREKKALTNSGFTVVEKAGMRHIAYRPVG